MAKAIDELDGVNLSNLLRYAYVPTDTLPNRTQDALRELEAAGRKDLGAEGKTSPFTVGRIAHDFGSGRLSFTRAFEEATGKQVIWIASQGHLDPLKRVPPLNLSGNSPLLNGTYEPKADDHLAARTVERAPRADERYRAAFAGMPVTATPHLLGRHEQLGAAILAQLSGPRFVTYTTGFDGAPKGIALETVVGVSARASHRAHLVAGHEMWHWLKQKRDPIAARSTVAIDAQSENPMPRGFVASRTCWRLQTMSPRSSEMKSRSARPIWLHTR